MREAAEADQKLRIEAFNKTGELAYKKVAELKSALVKAREEFRTILHSDTCLPKDIALKTIAEIDAALKGELK